MVLLQTMQYPDPLLVHPCTQSGTFLATVQPLDRQGNVAIGYLGSSHSAPHEIYEETLHLSKLLKLEVLGIQTQFSSCLGRSNSDNIVVSNLVTTWQTFFSENSSGSFIQYFFGDSVYVIERALVLFTPSSSQTLTFIGVNPSRYPSFPCQLIQDSVHSRLFRKNYTGLPLSTSHNAQSIFFKRFNDPTFSSALVSAFSEITGIDSSSNSPIPDHFVAREVTYTLELAPPPPSRTMH